MAQPGKRPSTKELSGYGRVETRPKPYEVKKRMARKPLPKNVTEAQRVADLQAGKSERAGHKMIRENPPKVSVRTWLKSKLGLGPPKAERDRQKKIREALRATTIPGAASRATKRAARRPATRGGSRR